MSKAHGVRTGRPKIEAHPLRFGVALGPLLLVGCAAHRRESPGFRAPAVTSVDQDSRDEGAFVGTAKNASAKPYAVGKGTWYGDKFAGKKTASGEPFDPRALTAAHRKLPFGTWVEVRRRDTGAVVRVRINDRGPFGHDDWIIDLSLGAAEKIDLVRAGVVPVELRVVSGPE